MSNTIMVSLSLLLTLLRIVVLLVVWPLYKVLEKTNRLYQEAMETTHELLSL
jgi:hypothetical protein